LGERGWWRNIGRIAEGWSILLLLISLITLISLIKFLLLILSFLLLMLKAQDPLSNDYPITVPIPLVSNSSASYHKKSEQDLLMVWVLNGATPSVQDRHVSKGDNVEHSLQKMRL